MIVIGMTHYYRDMNGFLRAGKVKCVNPDTINLLDLDSNKSVLVNYNFLQIMYDNAGNRIYADGTLPRKIDPTIGKTMTMEKINHPLHYGGDTVYETIKVIEAWGLNFNLGNAVKYISRAGKKDDLLEDLKKANFYLEREIQIVGARIDKQKVEQAKA